VKLFGWRQLRLILTSFSILKRIVMGETTVGQQVTHGQLFFQYPQADRDG